MTLCRAAASSNHWAEGDARLPSYGRRAGLRGISFLLHALCSAVQVLHKAFAIFLDAVVAGLQQILDMQQITPPKS